MGDVRPGAISLDEFPDGGEEITLEELKDRIESWIYEYGETATLQLDAGHNNISADVVPEPNRPRVQVYVNSSLVRVGKVATYKELVDASGYLWTTNRVVTIKYYYGDERPTKTLPSGRSITCEDSMRFIVTSKPR